MNNKSYVDFSAPLTPIDFVREMLRNTAEDGTIYLNNWYDVDCVDCQTYNGFVANIKWSDEDAEYAINEYNRLFEELDVIADHLDELDGTIATAHEVLPDELVASYCIFVSPFEATNQQELRAEVIGRVSDGPCGYELIRQSQRLCRLLSLNAPELVVQNEARMLCASLVIHSFGEGFEKVG